MNLKQLVVSYAPLHNYVVGYMQAYETMGRPAITKTAEHLAIEAIATVLAGESSKPASAPAPASKPTVKPERSTLDLIIEQDWT